VVPQAVVFPKNSKDIQQLVSFAQKENEKNPQSVSLTVRSAGTCMSGGSLNDSIIIDVTRYMNTLIEVTDEYAVMQPGLYYRDLEKETLKRN
jgi:FAD/FMN-containing dehydrogenase